MFIELLEIYFVSKFAKDNNAFFELHSNKCYLKSQAPTSAYLRII